MEVDEDVYSTAALLRPKIENIDVEDLDDPQLVVDYVNEIYGYMRDLENKQSIRQAYLSRFKGKNNTSEEHKETSQHPFVGCGGEVNLQKIKYLHISYI